MLLDGRGYEVEASNSIPVLVVGSGGIKYRRGMAVAMVFMMAMTVLVVVIVIKSLCKERWW